MSHNYTNRMQLPPHDTDRRSNPGPYGSSDRRRASPDLYGRPQEPLPHVWSSMPSTSRTLSPPSRGPEKPPHPTAHWSADAALSILSSCGLEPNDLSLLAELPEDVLTVDSLPQVLQQIKGKRAVTDPYPYPYPPPGLSSSSSSASPSRSRWDNRPFQLDRTLAPPTSLSPERVQDWQESWGDPRRSSSSRVDSSLPSTSAYVVDYNHRVGGSAFGKTGRDAGLVSTGDWSSYSSSPATGSCVETHPSGFSEPGSADYRSAPPLESYRPASAAEPLRTDAVSSSRSRSSGGSDGRLVTRPSRKKAYDFHGKTPTTYPYTCSLCDITVLSDKVWTRHVHGTLHADGQLGLLQQCPEWDCRLEAGRTDTKEEDPGPHDLQPNRKKTKKVSSKVVCAKFPSHSVDETQLRKLTQPFGKIVKIIMFPSFAYMELGSSDQAKDLVKFHINQPACVNGHMIDFSISATLNFLQSSRVLSFSPAPSGEHGCSDLIAVVKRFGPPLYTLFLPSMAFVEMKDDDGAQKVVDYYTSTPLKINNDIIKVAYSGEYKSLMRLPSAKRYEERSSSSTKRRSPSQGDEDKRTAKRRRRSSSSEKKEMKKERVERESKRERDEKESRQERERRGGQKERGESKKDRKREQEEKDRKKKPEEKDRKKEQEEKDRKKKTEEKDRKKEQEEKDRKKEQEEKDRKKEQEEKDRKREQKKDCRKEQEEKDPGSEAKEKKKSTEEKDGRSRDGPSRCSEEQSEKPEGTEAAPPADEPEAHCDAQSEAEEESDIDGMEVIGEDGENLEEEDMVKEEETPEEEEGEPADEDEQLHDEEPEVERKNTEEEHVKDPREEEEEPVKKGDEEAQKPTKRKEEEKEKPTKKSKVEEKEKEAESTREEEEEADFPMDLEDCIVLDEDKGDDEGDKDRSQRKSRSPGSRVVYVGNLPRSNRYTDMDFVKIVKGFGKASRFLVLRQRQEGFIEMSKPSEAAQVVKELHHKHVIFHGTRLIIDLSIKYTRLMMGWDVPDKESDEGTEDSRSSGRRSERNSKSKASEKDGSSKKSPGKKESSKKTPEKKHVPKSSKEPAAQKLPEKESASKKTPVKEPAAQKLPEKESASKKEPAAQKLPEKESASKKEPAAQKLPEKESASKKRPAEQQTVSTKNQEKESGPQKNSKEKMEESESKTSPEKEPVSKSSDKELRSKKTGEKKKGQEKERRAGRSPEGREPAEEEPAHIHQEECVSEDTSQRDTPETKTQSDQDQETTAQSDQETMAQSVKDQEMRGQSAKDEEATKAPQVCSEEADSKPRQEDPTLEEIPEKTQPGADKEAAELEDEGKEEPAGGSKEPRKPTKPVGTEFVGPVVGYFCKLCQVIYASEDEAKQEHCSTASHYQKYQEHTGKDPWAQS
ncbi:matrin 3-like 1.1 [Genypterus blacodes]|uniref:matrin 3-like 1.1 n=1 Tax=Genypterus blacodes TaxID=154954 RepID=UPI003F75EC30